MQEQEHDMHIGHCGSCGCQMDTSSLEPYTNVVCPECGEHTRVKCELGNYRLIGRHAVGGMSKLFVARDMTLGREVAIKILNDEYCRDEHRMRQFEHEAMITAAISHPHVVRVFTVGKAFGHFYIAMELVLGESLEQRIAREGAISEAEILPLCEEIIAGLRAAQDAGLIHRDIKPGNILFDTNDHVKIVDFGLALVTQGGVAKAEEIWATPYYVPPEALTGDHEDFRSDMYALGATLYHALSGKPSIPEQSKSSREVLHDKEHIEPLAKIAPWLKPETCQWVERAMAFQREDRFESYAEMEEARALANHVIDEVGASDPVYFSERDQRRARDKIIVTVLVVTVLIALIAILAVVVFKNKNGADEERSGSAVIMNAAMFTEDDSYSPELAAEIGKLFYQSHKQLREGRYLEAKAIFEKLMNDTRVVEPAASWAGVEAVIAAWLAGDTQKAEVASSGLAQHIQNRKVASDSHVALLAKQLSGTEIITKFNKDEGSMMLLQMMAVALKNWEIGAWDAAVPLFKGVEKMELPEESPLRVYHKIAKKYLADHAQLKSLSPLPMSADKKQVEGHMAELKKAANTLKTKGRAKFHIRVWQTRAELHLEKLEKLERENKAAAAALKAQAEKLKVPSYQEQLPQFHKLLELSKFTDARKLLQKAATQPGEIKKRDAWIYLSTSAGSFLDDISKAPFKSSLRINVYSVGGRMFDEVVAANQDGLRLKGDDGEISLPWSNIQAESILGIYRQLFELSLETLDGQRRTEHAICYAWLMNLKAKAEPAVEALSEVNDNFKKRWQSTLNATGSGEKGAGEKGGAETKPKKAKR